MIRVLWMARRVRWFVERVARWILEISGKCQALAHRKPSPLVPSVIASQIDCYNSLNHQYHSNLTTMSAHQIYFR